MEKSDIKTPKPQNPMIKLIELIKYYQSSQFLILSTSVLFSAPYGIITQSCAAKVDLIPESMHFTQTSPKVMSNVGSNLSLCSNRAIYVILRVLCKNFGEFQTPRPGQALPRAGQGQPTFVKINFSKGKCRCLPILCKRHDINMMYKHASRGLAISFYE